MTPADKAVLADTQPLSPANFRDLERLFAGKGCSFARDCWCMVYRLPRGWKAPENTEPAAAKKALLKDLAADDLAPGLIGYDDTQEPVGWVAVGPRECFAKLQRSRVMRPLDETPAWAVVCFVVPSPHRGRGVASALLHAAVSHAAAHGAHALEGFPVDADEKAQSAFLWHGTKTMFDRAGFLELTRRTPQRPFMRRELP